MLSLQKLVSFQTYFSHTIAFLPAHSQNQHVIEGVCYFPLAMVAIFSGHRANAFEAAGNWCHGYENNTLSYYMLILRMSNAVYKIRNRWTILWIYALPFSFWNKIQVLIWDRFLLDHFLFHSVPHSSFPCWAYYVFVVGKHSRPCMCLPSSIHHFLLNPWSISLEKKR